MPYLLLYGSGWTQRWRVAEGQEEHVRAAITRLGKDETSKLSVLDPGTDAPVTLVVHWAQVATAVLLDPDSTAPHEEAPGQYP